MRKVLLIAGCCLLHTLLSFSYSIDWQWARNSSGPNDQTVISTATDRMGNFYIEGWFSGDSITLGSFTLLNPDTIPNGGYIFVAKYDSSGNVLWARKIGKVGINYEFQVWSITADNRGNIYLSGDFRTDSISFGAITLFNSGPLNTADIFIAKYDSVGNILWARKAGGSLDDLQTSMVSDSSGNVFLVGNFTSDTITLGTISLANTTPTFVDFFVAKYDAGGNLLWATSSGGRSNDLALSLATDGSGNVYVTGFFMSNIIAFGTDTLINSMNSGFNNTAFVAKYSSSGNVLWGKSAGGTSEGQCIATDLRGNSYITGRFSSDSVTFGSSSLINAHAGTDDVFISKYGPVGNIIWAKRAGGSKTDQGSGIATDASGNVYVVGSFYSDSITFDSATLIKPFNGADPSFVVTFTTGGNLLCAEALASGGNQQSSLIISQVGSLYIAGAFDTIPFVVGTDTLHLSGLANAFVAKFDCPNAQAQFNAGINLLANVNCADSCTGILTAYASGGIRPYTYNWSTSAINSDTITGLCAGIYYVTITDSSGTAIIDSAIISQPTPLVHNFILNNPTCNGWCNGAISVNFTGGTNPYNFCLFYFIPSPNACVSHHFQRIVYQPPYICAGIPYYLEVTDANGCFLFDSVILHDPPGLMIDSIVTQTLGSGLCNGTSRVYASGGVPPYYFSWTDTTLCGGDSCSNLCPGRVLFTLSDYNGCVVDSMVTYCGNYQVPLISSGDTVLCKGDSLQLSASLPSSYRFQWLKNGYSIAGATDSIYIVIDSAGIYALRADDTAGCTLHSDSIIVRMDSANCASGINNISGIGDFSLWPNPALDNLNITCQLSNESDIQISVKDIIDKNVITFFGEKVLPGKYTRKIIVNSLAPGIYFVCIASHYGSICRKFIKY